LDGKNVKEWPHDSPLRESDGTGVDMGSSRAKQSKQRLARWLQPCTKKKKCQKRNVVFRLGGETRQIPNLT